MSLSEDMREAIRASDFFVCLVDHRWLTHAPAQAQARYARQCHKPFLVCVCPGVRLPEEALVGIEDLTIVQLEHPEPAIVAAHIQAWIAARRRHAEEGQCEDC